MIFPLEFLIENNKNTHQEWSRISSEIPQFVWKIKESEAQLIK